MEWKPVSERPSFDHQPSRQFIRIEGSKDHSGYTFGRAYCGLAYIRPLDAPDGMLGYKKSDIVRLCEEGDIDLYSAEVTHWAPAIFPNVN